MQKQLIKLHNGKAGHVINFIIEKPMMVKPSVKEE